MEKTTVFELRDKYLNKKESGYDIDLETGSIIVYALDAIYYDGLYYSMSDGHVVCFDNYVKSIRKYVQERPIHVPGTGVIVYRKNSIGEVEILLQLRQDFDQYGLPGGGIETGETYQDCAVNELLQETAFVAPKEELQLTNVYAGPKHITKYPNGDIVFHTVVVFKIAFSKCKKAQHKVDIAETKRIDWMTLNQIRKLLKEGRVFPNNIPILEDIVNMSFE